MGVALTATLSLAACSQQSHVQPPRYFVQGIVIDSLGVPVSGVHVEIEFNAIKELTPPEAGTSHSTDRRGRFAFIVTGPCRSGLSVQDNRGRLGDADLVLPRDSGRVFTIRLLPIPKSVREL